MALNEAPRRMPREKYPAQFDIEGIPRDREIRAQKLKELQTEDIMSSNTIDISNLSADQIEALRAILVQADSKRSENVFDLSKPPKQPYTHQEFPKMLYNSKGHVVKAANSSEESALKENGYRDEPHPEFDYSRIDRNSMHAAKHETPQEYVTEEQQAAALNHQAKQVDEERKKNRRS